MVRLVLLRLLESYFRHRWLYLLPLALMAGLAAYFTATAKPKYLAEGVLYVQNQSLLASLTAVSDNSGSWWVTPAQATTNELGELLQTDSFVRAVIQQTDLEPQMDQGDAAVGELIDQVRQSIWAYPLGDNQLLISATWEKPQVTYQLVHAVIEGYIQWQINAQRAESETAQAFFNDVIATYEDQLTAAREEMKRYLQAFPEPVRGDRPAIEQLELTRLQSAIDLAASRYANALDKEENTRLSLAQIESNARQTYLLIDAPLLPTEPETSLKEMAVSIVAFMAVGVILTLGAIVGSAILDRSLRFPVDVEHRLHLPVLAVVPDVTPRRPRFAWLRRGVKKGATAEEAETATNQPARERVTPTSQEVKAAL